MTDSEKSLQEREEALARKERELEEREKALENKPFSQAVQNKKEEWYDKVNLSVKQLDIIIGVAFGALGIVFILIILEACGIFAL